MARLHREILDELLDRIRDGRYAVGAVLPKEELLAEEFKVSRGTAREVFRALEERRVAIVKHGFGAMVQPREEWNVLDPAVGRALTRGRDRRTFKHELQELQRLLEGHAAAVAADRASGRQRTALDSAATDGGDPAAVVPEIRRLVVHAAGNRLIATTLRALADIDSPAATAAQADAYRRLAQAVADGDSDAARAAAHELNA